ncbi:MAG: DUF2125 domain-containing protein [Paracoccus sp. (in: a-proteobacteria)]|nr:DUF2125 domain-containing protein [Paracoccus sp. (in: a-proteobacteria)]
MIRLLSTSATALIVAAAPVFAEVTPVQVWDTLVRAYSEGGYTVTEGSREEAGQTLTINDVTLDASNLIPADPETAQSPTSVKLVIPRVVLNTTGDGNVRTVFEGDWTGEVSAPYEDGTPGTPVTIGVAMPSNEMITSGTPDAMNHALNYPKISAAITFRDQKGTEVPVNLIVTDTKGSYNTSGTAETGTKADYDMTSGRAAITVDSAIPGENGQPGGHIKADLAMTDLATKGSMGMPAGNFNMGEDMNAALKAGATVAASLGFAGYEGTADFSGQDENGAPQSGNATFTGGRGNVDIRMDDKGVGYAGTSEAASINVTANSIPFPLSYSAGLQSFDVHFPVMQSDTAQPFTFKYALADLTLGDAIWGLFDPTAQLPRDPASLTIDVGGDLMVTRDVMDPEFQKRMAAASTPAEGSSELTAEQLAALETLQAEAVPFQPVKVTLNQIALNAIGAKADLNGELTAGPNGDFSQPAGTINGTFSGVNTLIDRLASLGLIPQDQVAAARMMLMVFAKPVEGQTDTLETRIEMREDGSIFANGQQMQ